MGWFDGKKERVAKPMASMFKEETSAERAAREAAYERAAIAAEPGVLARIPAEQAANEDEHRRQVAGFSFECRRFGDFLTLFIERMEQKLATSVNIAATREIRLYPGHAPDFNGQVLYRLSSTYVVNDDGTRDDEEHKVWPDYITSAHARRQLFALDEKREDRNNFMYSGPRHTGHRTANFPRPAEDDSIRFEGIGATLYAPFGCGQAAHDAILKEIEAYRKTVRGK